MAVTHGDIGLSQPVASTITFKLDAVSLDANSTAVLREVMVLGSPQTSNALAAVTAAVPVSTEYGLAVRIVSGPSTFTDMPVRTIAPSTYGDGGLFRVAQSSAGDLNVTVAGYVAPSTVIALSSNAGAFTSSNSSLYLPVRVTNGTAFTDAVAYNVHNSTGDFTGSTVTGLPAMLRSGAAAEGSTDHFLVGWGSSDGAQYCALVNSTGLNIEGSTAIPAHTVAGLHVRQVPSSYQSTIVGSPSSNSTVLSTAISSVAGLSHKVYGYFIGASTSGNVSTLVFLSSGQGGDAGAAKNRWQVLLSSGYGAANLAISPAGGAFLFKTDIGEALTYRIESASTRITPTIALSFMTEA